MRHIFTAGLMALGALAVPLSVADGEPARPRTGVAVTATWEDGTLLLRDAETFPLLVIGPNVTIQDAKGVPLALRDIRPGDRVEYGAERWAGMSFATAVRVVKPYRAEAR
jgi:hypothetical protein